MTYLKLALRIVAALLLSWLTLIVCLWLQPRFLTARPGGVGSLPGWASLAVYAGLAIRTAWVARGWPQRLTALGLGTVGGGAWLAGAVALALPLGCAWFRACP